MNGVRLSGISEEISEKQLKTHFSNPKYGGGHVSQIYYPLQDNGAVVLFDSPSGKKLYYYLSIYRLYSKTCVKRPLKIRQNKDLNDKW